MAQKEFRGLAELLSSHVCMATEVEDAWSQAEWNHGQ